jgi:hypothetical protein
MTETDSTRPLSPHERASVARLLEAAHGALMSEIRPEDGRDLLRAVTDALQRGALDIRRGYRAGDLDSVTWHLHAFVGDLLAKRSPDAPHPAG